MKELIETELFCLLAKSDRSKEKMHNAYNEFVQKLETFCTNISDFNILYRTLNYTVVELKAISQNNFESEKK